ncbi:hypothetical protein, partial [Lysinibacillus sp. NPDC056185]|uniref:hypothetical protein n=1 Tax=Lysinibacillus sp. NPDC056185 TaxID=3345739 RepID=UPI0039EF0F68
MGESELTALGIEPLDESVYRTLLRSPDLATADLCTTLGLDEAALQLCLKRLDQQGMVHLDADGGVLPVDPGIGVGQLAARRLKMLQEEQHEVLSTSHSVARRVLRWRS